MNKGRERREGNAHHVHPSMKTGSGSGSVFEVVSILVIDLINQ